ncbi:hypothetical protein ACVGOW_21510 [Pseudonocardia saturnea]
MSAAIVSVTRRQANLISIAVVMLGAVVVACLIKVLAARRPQSSAFADMYAAAAAGRDRPKPAESLLRSHLVEITVGTVIGAIAVCVSLFIFLSAR